jgi:hypothetical protein
MRLACGKGRGRAERQIGSCTGRIGMGECRHAVWRIVKGKGAPWRCTFGASHRVSDRMGRLGRAHAGGGGPRWAYPIGLG